MSSNGYINHMYSNQRQQPQIYGKPQPQIPLNPAQLMYNVLQGGGNSSLGIHHSRQIDAAQKARIAGGQAHHHARVAASQQRMSQQGNPVTLLAPSQQSAQMGSTSSLSGAQDQIPSIAKTASEQSSWTALDMGGMMINHLQSGLFAYKFLTSLYLNHNNLSSLPSLISQLRCLQVLNLAGNKLSSLPIELSLLSSLKELLLFDNQLTFIPNELGQLYHLEMLGLEGNPMSEPIASMIIEKGTTAVIKYLRDSCPLPTPPADREWIEIEDGNLAATSESFTVMCYNTLCEKYATPQTFGYTPAWALAWDYRKDLLLQEILNYSADIICLQEIEMRQYEDFFKEQLSQLAEYDGEFFPKSRSRTMGEYERSQVDGCATLFKLLEKHHIEFQQIAMQRTDLRRSADVLNRVMIKDNVAIILLLESIENGSKILVSNAHLHWDPLYSDVKVIQTALLVAEIQNSASQWTKSYSCTTPIPILLCGDLNSLPDSGVVEFLSKGSISADHKELQEYNYQPFTDHGLEHNFSLKSAYSLADDIDFTNFTPMFKGIIDYIWYDTSTIVTTGLLGGVDRLYASKSVGFPNPQHPSDHIPLVVSMKLFKNKRGLA